MTIAPSFRTDTHFVAARRRSLPEPPCTIPYQGSKRKLATAILACFPDTFPTLYEPFCGSAAVSLAAGLRWPSVAIRLNDNNEALAALWREIIDRPKELGIEYTNLWYAQQGREREFYDEVRTRFNASSEPHLFLYLLARCVKAAVRYNGRGEFNQSPDNRRLGAQPLRMCRNILAASLILRGRTEVSSVDFRTALTGVTSADVVYMDPPYQGVSTNRDRRYADVLDFQEFATALEDLNRREVSYIISYDGRTGQKIHGKPLPETLRLSHFQVDGGPSSQATLSGRTERTIESLYLSPALIERLGGPPPHLQGGRSLF